MGCQPLKYVIPHPGEWNAMNVITFVANFIPHIKNAPFTKSCAILQQSLATINTFLHLLIQYQLLIVSTFLTAKLVTQYTCVTERDKINDNGM